MSGHQLAQLNVAVLKAPLDSPQLADFVAALDRINALAEGSPGFLWRLMTDDGDATALRPLDPDTIVNLSVWRDAEALNQFVYRSQHREVLRRRREWFQQMADAHMVLWWVPAGHRPSVDEALARLELLRRDGPSPAAFTFRQAFPAPGTAVEAPDDFGDACPAY